MHRFVATTMGVFALVTVAVGCSDDTTSTDTAASTTVVASASVPVDTDVTDETAITDDTVTPDDTSFQDPVNSDAPGFGTDFCTINDSLNEAASAAIDGDGTPAGLQQFFEVEFPAQFAEMSAAAPADLADDMVVLGEGFTALGQLFADNEWDLEAAFNDPELNNVLDDQTYVDAGTAVDAYCGG